MKMNVLALIILSSTLLFTVYFIAVLIPPAASALIVFCFLGVVWTFMDEVRRRRNTIKFLKEQIALNSKKD